MSNSPREPKVYMLVPIFKRTEHIPNLLDRTKKQDYPNLELVLIDHSPIPCLPPDIPDFVTSLRGTPDMWWSGAMNVGLKYVFETEPDNTESFIIFMNDDVGFSKDLASNLVSSSQRLDAAIGPITLQSDQETIIDADNTISILKARHLCPHRGSKTSEIKDQYLETDILKGRGVIYPTHWAKQIGLTNPKLHYRADPEYAYRFKKRGFRLYIDTTIQVTTDIGPQSKITEPKRHRRFVNYLFSPKSTQNLPAALKYFLATSNPMFATWSFSIHLLRTSIVGIRIALK